MLQNYTLKKLEKHTNYIVTIAARNYVGLGPSDVIELRTEDGGKFKDTFPRTGQIYFVDIYA